MTKYEPVYPRHTWALASKNLPKFRKDMKEICGKAIEKGANLARLIPASKVAVDERVTLKCRIPFCECYGKCLMDPPFSPTAEETRKVVRNYKYGILTEVSSTVPKGYWDMIQREDMPLCRLQYQDEAIDFERRVQMPLWFKLHDIVMAIEREAHNRGYFFAVGYVASTCYLCYDSAKHTTYCDTSSLCRHPYEARPSMEAAGIDVFSTYANSGLKLRMASPEKFSWSGLVLVV
jgi:predicted metal-binding protein